MIQDPNRHPDSEDGERVVVRDRRRIDPETGAVRTPDDSDRSGHDASTPRSARGGRPAPDQNPSGAAEPQADIAADDPRVVELTAEVAERTADLQRLSAEYANYRRRVDRDREAVLVTARAMFDG